MELKINKEPSLPIARLGYLRPRRRGGLKSGVGLASNKG